MTRHDGKLHVPVVLIADDLDRPWFELVDDHPPRCPCTDPDADTGTVAVAHRGMRWRPGSGIYRPADYDTRPYSPEGTRTWNPPASSRARTSGAPGADCPPDASRSTRTAASPATKTPK